MISFVLSLFINISEDLPLRIYDLPKQVCLASGNLEELIDSIMVALYRVIYGTCDL